MVTDFYWPELGGVEQHVRTLAHSLCDRGHRVSVVTLATGDLPTRDTDGPVHIERIRTTTQRIPILFAQPRPWAPPAPDPGAVWALRRIIRRLAPDIIHGHDWLSRSLFPLPSGAPPVVSSLHYYTLTCAKKDLVRRDAVCPGPSLRRCLACAGRHYGIVKGSVVAGANAIGRRLEERGVEQFVAVSRATARGNGLSTADQHHTVIPNFLPAHDDPLDTALEPLMDSLPKTEYFLYVGDFRTAKGFDVLLEAYSGLDTARPLVIIGKRWPTSPTSFPEGTVVLENWPNRAVRAAFDRARAAIVPSVWSEPFGIVTIEAMASGVPVIASAIGGITDIVEDQRTGLLIAPGSVPELVAAMRRLDEDDDLRASLGASARNEADRYRADRVVPLIEAEYIAAIERHAARL